jgi:hypothetical protein
MSFHPTEINEKCISHGYYVASDWKFGLSGIFQQLRITSGGCKSAWCAIPRFYTPQDPKPSFRVQFRLFAHRETGRMTAIGIRQAFRRPEMPFSTAISLYIAAEGTFPLFANTESVFLRQI